MLQILRITYFVFSCNEVDKGRGSAIGEGAGPRALRSNVLGLDFLPKPTRFVCEG